MTAARLMRAGWRAGLVAVEACLVIIIFAPVFSSTQQERATLLAATRDPSAANREAFSAARMRSERVAVLAKWGVLAVLAGTTVLLVRAFRRPAQR